MAKQIPGFAYTLEASADLSAKQYFGMVPDSAGEAAVVGAGVAIAGVLQNDDCDAQGKVCTIQQSGITKGIAGAAMATIGVEVEMDASGKFIALAAGVGVGFLLGPAAGADGDLVTILLN